MADSTGPSIVANSTAALLAKAKTKHSAPGPLNATHRGSQLLVRSFLSGGSTSSATSLIYESAPECRSAAELPPNTAPCLDASLSNSGRQAANSAAASPGWSRGDHWCSSWPRRGSTCRRAGGRGRRVGGGSQATSAGTRQAGRFKNSLADTHMRLLCQPCSSRLPSHLSQGCCRQVVNEVLLAVRPPQLAVRPLQLSKAAAAGQSSRAWQ